MQNYIEKIIFFEDYHIKPGIIFWILALRILVSKRWLED